MGVAINFYFSKMIKLPINLKISNRYSKIPLNDEWNILCDWFLSESFKLNIDLERNTKLVREEILISGELSVLNIISMKPHAQSKIHTVIKYPYSYHLVQMLISPKIPGESVYKKEFCILRGTIFFISTNKCGCGWESAKGEKCIQPKSLVQQSNDFDRLLEQETPCFADLKLICGNVSIPAHKVILSARSPVFDAMLKNPMKESRDNEVHITDIDAPVLQAMLMYIYTGKVSELTITSAIDLLVAADKYLIQGLKEVCYVFLDKNLTFKHVLTVLIRGGICLKAYAMDYISKKSKDFSLIENTEEWKDLKNQSPDLAVEILECLVKSKG